MAIPLTFLAAANGKALAKTITADRTIPYPRVKAMNSHSHFVADNRDGLEEAFDLFVQNAAEGNTFLKGMLRKPLENESRAGQTDKYALTQTLVIDVDSLPMNDLPEAPYTREDVAAVARRVQEYLPEPLRHVSCIAHAGSSFGVAEGKVSMHLIYLLKRPVGPEGMKEWLIRLNFDDPMLRELLDLTPQNVAIKYIIDPVLAHNTHLLFIADPKFSGRSNPFEDNSQRWALLDQGPATIDLIPLLEDTCPQQNKQAIEKRLTELRKAKGLAKFKPKMRTVTGMAGDKIQVISNPDAMRVEFAYENDEFVYFNVNGGDSSAYFCPKHNPDIIYNFKNEPPFELAKANPAVYEWYIDKYSEVIRERSDLLPVVFRDFASDKHYAALVAPGKDAIERMAEIQKHNVDDWLAEQGRSVPDPIPTWDIEFDPQGEIVYDPHRKVLNRFQLNPILRNPIDIMPQYHCTLGEVGNKLGELCPTVAKIIWHITGSSETEYEYFLNWLAAVIQLRRKLATAWVFSGVPGTGKGVFYDYILRPLIGEAYARKKRIDHLEDKFDSHMAETLIAVYDEFRLQDARDASKALDKIKDEIAAETGEIRAMRQESQTRKLYANYLFFSNHTDAVRIEEGDRRFNVCPPQMRKLLDTYVGLEKDYDKIEEELPQFASFLMHYTIDERAARTCLENEAKERMKEAALSWHEQFCLALRRGDLDYFLDDLSGDIASSDVNEVFAQNSARKVIDEWIRCALINEPVISPVTHLYTVYCALAPQATTRKKFATMLSRNDVDVQRLRVGGVRERAIQVQFHSRYRTDEELEQLKTGKGPTFKENSSCQPALH